MPKVKNNLVKHAEKFISHKLLDGFVNKDYAIGEDGFIYFQDPQVTNMFHAYLIGVVST